MPRSAAPPASTSWRRILRTDLARLSALVWLFAALAAPPWSVRAQPQGWQETLLASICRTVEPEAPADGKGRAEHPHDAGCCVPASRHSAIGPLPAGAAPVPAPAMRLLEGSAWMPAAPAAPPASPSWHPHSARAPPDPA